MKVISHSACKMVLAALTAAMMLTSVSASAQTLDVKNTPAQTASSAEQKFEQGIAAYKRQDYATALKIFSELANQGYADAQNNLGFMYENGQGVAKDYRQALLWYQKAVSQEHIDAQYNLGFMYANGLGVAQDYRQALLWYQKAASQGHIDAQYNLGFMYADGLGVAQDFKQARFWFEKAAAQGNVKAKAVLQQLNQMGK